jgi:hypothetical protein
MRLSLISLALTAAVSISTAAMADEPAPGAAPPAKVKSGEWIYSSDGAAIGRVDYVQKGKDGAPEYVGVIHDMKILHIPADSLTPGQKGYVTPLTRADVLKLK